MWCLEKKSGPSLTATCPLYSHNSWWVSDLQQNLRPCNQTCSVCSGRDHHLDGFFKFLLSLARCTNLHAAPYQHVSSSQLYLFIKPLCLGFKHHPLPPFFQMPRHRLRLTCPPVPCRPSVLRDTPVSISSSVCPPAITNPCAALN